MKSGPLISQGESAQPYAMVMAYAYNAPAMDEKAGLW
jgi:hypothetical protein